MQLLQEVLPKSMVFIETNLSQGRNICIACNSGKDVSVGVSLTALQKFFDEDGNCLVSNEAQGSRTVAGMMEH